MKDFLWDLFLGLGYGLQFANLMLPLNLCAKMFGQLGAKIHKASELDARKFDQLGVKIHNA